MAYGQTGSGKTFTMGTNLSLKDFLAPDPRGVVPRVLAVLFSYLSAASKTYDIALTVVGIEMSTESQGPIGKVEAKLEPGP
jgi:hypothetical protein